MKYFVIAALCACLVLEVVAGKHSSKPTRRPRPPKPQKCYTSEDCEPDECCVGDPKKFFKKAECRKLEVEGNRCSEEDAHFKGKYLLRCPCVEGLACESKPVLGRPGKEGKLKFNARCVDPSTTPEPEQETEEPEQETEEPEQETEEPEQETEEPEQETEEPEPEDEILDKVE